MLYTGNATLLVLSLPLVGLWVRLLFIPRPLLYGGILVFAELGTYGLKGSLVDLVTLFINGLAGFIMWRYGFPVAPAVVGMILGPLAEQQFRWALSISRGDAGVFMPEPIAAALLAAALLAVAVPLITPLLRGRRR